MTGTMYNGGPASDLRPLVCRGIRGATTADSNTAEDILEATTEMMAILIRLNEIEPEHVVSAIFTTSPDLNATFPAVAAREMGWSDVPLMCAHEMDVPASLQKAVRVLLHINTTRTPSEIRHVYLKGARQLRPEWAYDESETSASLIPG